jgi:glucose/arabinose dehydrogenase
MALELWPWDEDAASARPSGVAFGADGALYFTSDDGIEGLFRLRWAGLESG